MNIVIQPCNDCKKIRVFKMNKHQEPFYYKGIRLRECEKCGRYEELIKIKENKND
jgi:DTW domain-containing protein YfiP